MRCIGAPLVAPTAWTYSSLICLPAQNSCSNAVFAARVRARPNSLVKITVQLASEASINPAMTSCTIRLAWVTRVKMEKS